MKITKPTTVTIDYYLRFVNALCKHSDNILTGTIFNRPTVAEKMEFLKTKANTEANLWYEARKEYPEIIGVKTAAIDNYGVSWDVPDEAPIALTRAIEDVTQ